MSKLLKTPASRLICFGGAKACTNISVGSQLEDDPRFEYEP